MHTGGLWCLFLFGNRADPSSNSSYGVLRSTTFSVVVLLRPLGHDLLYCKIAANRVILTSSVKGKKCGFSYVCKQSSIIVGHCSDCPYICLVMDCDNLTDSAPTPSSSEDFFAPCTRYSLLVLTYSYYSRSLALERREHSFRVYAMCARARTTVRGLLGRAGSESCRRSSDFLGNAGTDRSMQREIRWNVVRAAGESDFEPRFPTNVTSQA